MKSIFLILLLSVFAVGCADTIGNNSDNESFNQYAYNDDIADGIQELASGEGGSESDDDDDASGGNDDSNNNGPNSHIDQNVAISCPNMGAYDYMERTFENLDELLEVATAHNFSGGCLKVDGSIVNTGLLGFSGGCYHCYAE